MGLFTNIFVLYLCIMGAISFWQPEMVLGDSPQAQNILTFFNIQTNDLDNSTIVGASFGSASGFNTQTAEERLLAEGRSTDKDNSPASNIFLSVIDPIWNALNYIILFFRILFCLIIVLNNIGAPYYIVMIFGVIPTFSGLASLIMMIRGYG